VQEPTKDTVPVRELFPRRICLRVASKTHVAMVLGDQAYDRGAWANRIGESEPGVGYLFGEGIREPLRVRASWVPDHVIKELEAFVTARVLPMPRPAFELPPVPSPLGESTVNPLDLPKVDREPVSIRAPYDVQRPHIGTWRPTASTTSTRCGSRSPGSTSAPMTTA
jgi:DNA segregation ATPase FtsK/SpoIIIE-like protein